MPICLVWTNLESMNNELGPPAWGGIPFKILMSYRRLGPSRRGFVKTITILMTSSPPNIDNVAMGGESTKLSSPSP